LYTPWETPNFSQNIRTQNVNDFFNLSNLPDTIKDYFKPHIDTIKDLKIDFEVISVTQESIDLATDYIKEKVVGQTSLDDCIHIATATINKVDLLISWNFRHIVNVLRIRGYNSISLRNGYSTLEIRSPKDLINYED
jgi:dihydrodipicolinate reductase